MHSRMVSAASRISGVPCKLHGVVSHTTRGRLACTTAGLAQPCAPRPARCPRAPTSCLRRFSSSNTSSATSVSMTSVSSGMPAPAPRAGPGGAAERLTRVQHHSAAASSRRLRRQQRRHNGSDCMPARTFWQLAPAVHVVLLPLLDSVIVVEAVVPAARRTEGRGGDGARKRRTALLAARSAAILRDDPAGAGGVPQVECTSGSGSSPPPSHGSGGCGQCRVTT